MSTFCCGVAPFETEGLCTRTFKDKQNHPFSTVQNTECERGLRRLKYYCRTLRRSQARTLARELASVGKHYFHISNNNVLLKIVRNFGWQLCVSRTCLLQREREFVLVRPSDPAHSPERMLFGQNDTVLWKATDLTVPQSTKRPCKSLIRKLTKILLLLCWVLT